MLLTRHLIAAAVLLVGALLVALVCGSLFSLPLVWAGLRPGLSMLIGVTIVQVLLVLELTRHTEQLRAWTGVVPVLGLIPYAWQRAGVLVGPRRGPGH